MTCEYCKQVLPELLALKELRKANRYKKSLCKDVYSIIENKIIKDNTYVLELDTPCNVHYFTEVVCFNCIRSNRLRHLTITKKY